ncbi:hypothetical protein PUN28_010483 [Cardiocondyla obscurior]|uniref:Uncharacterized protein n=1 Tax=Cardiocondyla obscurior TaxID=286306 RepID=A0AAW2FI88_9HYME
MLRQAFVSVPINFIYIINLLNVYCTYVGKLNGMVITDEMHKELNQVAASNVQGYANMRNGFAPGEDAANNALDDISEKSDRNKSGSSSGAEKEEGQLSPKVLVMQPILRFLQLLCENHNRELQSCENKEILKQLENLKKKGEKNIAISDKKTRSVITEKTDVEDTLRSQFSPRISTIAI